MDATIYAGGVCVLRLFYFRQAQKQCHNLQYEKIGGYIKPKK
jgi:hypothetical protein